MYRLTSQIEPATSSLDLRSFPNGRNAVASQGPLLTRALDVLHEGLAFFSLLEEPVHANATLRRILAEQPDGEELRREIRRFTESLGALARRTCHTRTVVEELAVRDVRTPEGSYLLRGSFVRVDEEGEDGLLMVAVEPAGAEFLSQDLLQARYGLTERELRVARLMTLGLSDGEVAGQLSISLHTARHHSEHVRQKLGVHSRGEVAARMLRVGRAAASAPPCAR